MAFIAVGIGTAVAGLGGAYMQSSAARDAANTQAAAAGQASAVQQHIYDQTRQDQSKWRDAGEQALADIQNSTDLKATFNMSDFQADPGYAFRMQEGQKAIERSAAARGGLMSGGTMKALTQYGQNVASDEYQKAYDRFNSDRDRRFNRLASIAGIGQTANSTVAAAGQNLGNQLGQNITGAANAQAAGQVGQANAWSGALTNGANTWMNYSMMNRMFPKAGG